MIRIAVVDDEIAFVHKIRQELFDFLRENAIMCQICPYTNSAAFLLDHNQNAFDLIYLDIDMPEINGIDLASEIRKKSTETCIIFVSGYSHLVFDTFQYAPYRFIRKKNIYPELLQSIQSYCNDIYQKKQYIKFQLANKEVCSICITKIMYFYSLRHDVFFVTESGESIKLANRAYTMDSLEQKMESFGFIRIHKTYLVNYRYIYQILEGEVLLAPFQDGKIERLPLSARRIVETKLKFQRLTRGGDLL